jgi:hypothetical protein
MSNPRDSGLWTPRTQEFTGGHNGREMIDYDINPNEDNDGLSHHTLQTPEDEESTRQNNPKARRERALRELTSVIPHISLKPEEIDDVLDRTPQMDGMQQLLESGFGVDMGQMANGGSLSAGANAGPIRSPMGQISYQSDIGKAIVNDKCTQCNRTVLGSKTCMFCEIENKAKQSFFHHFTDKKRPIIESDGNKTFDPKWQEKNASADTYTPMSHLIQKNDVVSYAREVKNAMNSKSMESDDQDAVMYWLGTLEQAVKSESEGGMPMLPPAYHIGKIEEILEKYGISQKQRFQQKNASEDQYTSLSDIIKGKRKYKGRRYSDDEESEEEEKKAKKKSKRKRKRKGKKKGLGGGSRQPKSKSLRRAKSAERNLSRSSRGQAFHPNVHSHAMRSIGSGRSEQIPLRLRDPIAYQRKLAYEKNRRSMGAMPRGMSHHADTRGIGGRGTVIGSKLPKVPKMGNNTSSSSIRDRLMEGAVGDPLGTSDPLNKAVKITQADLSNMKALLRELKRKIDKLMKAAPELEENAKVGASAESVGTDPGADAATKLNAEEQAKYRFCDTTQNQLTSKR